MDKLKLDIDNLGELIKQTFALRRETLEAISVLCRNDHPTFPTVQTEVMEKAVLLHEQSQEINRMMVQRKFMKSKRVKCECGNFLSP